MIGFGRHAVLVATVVAAALPASPVLAAASSTPTPTTPGMPSAAARLLLDSHLLWATIDVCNTAKHPNTVGIRGSMPGDGRAKDRLYMSFRLQYLNTATNVWSDLSTASPAFVAVGAGGSARQGGTSFQLVAGRAAVTMRGVVDFQWRRGSKVLLNAARMTTAGHKALAGADPAGYNAATCQVG
jgi:hypothetical protein